MARLYFAVFFIAASFVSFFNLYDERRRRGENWILTRSHCDVCGRILSWPSLIPLAGYFFSLGRCRCGAKISRIHPISEGIGGCLVIFLFDHSGLNDRMWCWILGVFLLYLLAVEDIRHKDVYTRDLIIGGIIFSMGLFLKQSIYPLSGIFIFVLMGMLYFFFPKAVGEGDIYFSALLALGIPRIWNSYLFFTCAFVTAAFIGGGMYFFKRIEERALPMFPFFLWAYMAIESFLS